MIKRLLLIVVLGVTVSGCFMVPMALLGPAASGFSTASISQSVISTSANYLLKQGTGKSFGEHAFDAILPDSKEIFQQAYLPKKRSSIKVAP